MTGPRLRAPLLALGLAGCLLLSAGAVGASRQVRVKVATTGDHSELIKRLPITRPGRTRPRVLMSLPTSRLHGLAAGDSLAVSAEVQVTTDCDEPGRRCLGDPYHYTPRISTYVVLAARQRTVRGRRIAPERTRLCRQASPNREHHCVLVRDEAPASIGGNPCARGRRCFVNLVGTAQSARAHRHEYVAVGGLRPNGAVPQDRGRLNAVRFSPAGASRGRRFHSARLLSDELRLDQRRTAILAERMGHLRTGDQVVVGARATVDISDLPYNVVLSSQLIVTDRAGDVVRGTSAHAISQRGELDEGNGFNCTQNKRRCTIRKVGVMSVKRAPRRAGRPVPLFLSLVTRAGPKHLAPAPGDRVEVVSGSVRGRRYPVRSALP